MTQETIIQSAAIYWSVANFATCAMMLLLWRTQRKLPFMLFAIAGFIKALWGLTVPGLNIEIVKVINSIFIPIIASTVYFFATYALIIEISKRGKIDAGTDTE